ncbi:LysR substrate-binding domain-containing protein [Rhizobium sp. TRM95111]|uniref:LysR substrate-binding domain-containing protein n=1 Tax=Rhizobium alarense TaxID=2846851 RepID=UPI001F32F720|nr:LysR substrate-binding domain-containing protein [Rhizobium alarense]MCF3643358.1 LysR substrate-binding domain-containing protein [Rhizobium alarense]
MVDTPRNFDMDVLRTFVTGVRLGSFARAAAALGRTPPAVSLQMRKLVDQTGQALFARKGRGLALTEAGETLLDYATRILELNDEAMVRLSTATVLDGWLRIGFPQDFAETSMPPLLGRFSRSHPKLRIEARVDRGARLVEAVERGELDLAVAWTSVPRENSRLLGSYPLVWIGAPGYRWRREEGPLPLIAFDPPCSFRAAAVEALKEAGIAWRHAFASPGLSGLWAAAGAGLGVTIRTPVGMPAGLRVLDPAGHGLPSLGRTALTLYLAASAPSAPARRFAELLVEDLAPEREAAP